jgi:hypothetical protein
LELPELLLGSVVSLEQVWDSLVGGQKVNSESRVISLSTCLASEFVSGELVESPSTPHFSNGT